MNDAERILRGLEADTRASWELLQRYAQRHGLAPLARVVGQELNSRVFPEDLSLKVKERLKGFQIIFEEVPDPSPWVYTFSYSKENKEDSIAHLMTIRPENPSLNELGLLRHPRNLTLCGTPVYLSRMSKEIGNSPCLSCLRTLKTCRDRARFVASSYVRPPVWSGARREPAWSPEAGPVIYGVSDSDMDWLFSLRNGTD